MSGLTRGRESYSQVLPVSSSTLPLFAVRFEGLLSSIAVPQISTKKGKAIAVRQADSELDCH